MQSMANTEETKIEYRKCSKCKGTMELTEEFFKRNRAKLFNKTCISCAEKRKKLKNEMTDEAKEASKLYKKQWDEKNKEIFGKIVTLFDVLCSLK